MSAPAFDADQLHNAAVTVAEVKRLGLPVRAAEIAVTTEITESGLVDLSGGDRDSEGLYQQRPSQGWGTPAQVTDPVYSTDSFLSRLTKVANWSSIAPWLAAQDVQISAFADGSNYQKNWAQGQALADQLYGTAGGQVAGGGVAGAITATPALDLNPLNGFGIPGAIGNAAGNAASSAASGVVSAVLPFLLKLTFIGGGLTLVIIGLYKTTSPAAKKAEAAVQGPAGQLAGGTSSPPSSSKSSSASSRSSAAASSKAAAPPLEDLAVLA